MKDKHLKDMCIHLGIQLPVESYNFIDEMLDAREIMPNYEPCIQGFVRAAEDWAIVIEGIESSEEAKDKEIADKLNSPLGIALNSIWDTIEFLVKQEYGSYQKKEYSQELQATGGCPFPTGYGVSTDSEGIMHIVHTKSHNLPELPQQTSTGLIGYIGDVPCEDIPMGDTDMKYSLRRLDTIEPRPHNIPKIDSRTPNRDK